MKKKLWIVSVILIVTGLILNALLIFNVSENVWYAIGGFGQERLCAACVATWVIGAVSLPYTITIAHENNTIRNWIFTSVVAIGIVVISFFLFSFSMLVCCGMYNSSVKVGQKEHPLMVAHCPGIENKFEECYVYFYKTGAITYTYCFTSASNNCVTYNENSVIFDDGINTAEIEYSRFKQ